MKVKPISINRLLIVAGIVMICLSAIFWIWLKVNLGLVAAEIDELHERKIELNQEVQALKALRFSLADDRTVVERARQLGLKQAQAIPLD